MLWHSLCLVMTMQESLAQIRYNIHVHVCDILWLKVVLYTILHAREDHVV